MELKLFRDTLPSVTVLSEPAVVPFSGRLKVAFPRSLKIRSGHVTGSEYWLWPPWPASRWGGWEPVWDCRRSFPHCGHQPCCRGRRSWVWVAEAGCLAAVQWARSTSENSPELCWATELRGWCRYTTRPVLANIPAVPGKDRIQAVSFFLKNT